MANLAARLFARAEAGGRQPALVFGGHSYTFAEIADRVRRLAGGLASVGVRAGSRVGLMMSARPEFLFCQQALFALGATLSPLNIFYRSGELLHCLKSCELEFLILEGEFVERLPPAAADGTEQLKAILTPSTLPGDLPGRIWSLDRVSVSAPPLEHPIDLPDDALGMLLNTSATTGKSKGVMLTIGNIRANYDQTPGWLGLGADSIILCALPLYNTFGLNQCINALMVTGGTLVLMPRFDAGGCIDLIERHRCTFLPAVPTMLQKIFDHPDAANRDLRSVKRIMTGGAPVPAALLERIRRAIGPDTIVLTGYGLTEATALVTLDKIEAQPDGRLARAKTIGRVLPGMQLCILREDGSEAGLGEVGEICLRGPNIMRGYFQMPADTAAALAGGWLHTGDLGYLDETGYAYIVDRKKDIIIRGGQNIYPADIEEAIYRIAGVREVAVVRREDDTFGEVPVAFIAIAPDAAVSADEVIAHCKAELAYFKVPAAVHFLPELPKGPTGKILRRGLTEGRDQDRKLAVAVARS